MEGKGVDADDVTSIQRQPGSLGCVAANHYLTGTMSSRLTERLPEKHIRRLVGKFQVGIGIGMHEKMPGSFVPVEETFDKRPVFLGNV
ncbi:hypothetical protein ABTM87_19445, partial [Acinetobacter baumannii]